MPMGGAPMEHGLSVSLSTKKWRSWSTLCGVSVASTSVSVAHQGSSPMYIVIVREAGEGGERGRKLSPRLTSS